MLVTERREHAKSILAVSICRRSGPVSIRPLNEAVVAAKYEAFKILVGNEVDHTADRVRTVGGGGTILENLDPPDRGGGEQVYVHRRDSDRSRCQSPAVEEHKGARRPQAAQVDGRNAFGTLRTRIELVRIADDTARPGQVLDEVQRSRGTLIDQFFLRDHVDRQRRVFRGSADQRPGDYDLPFLGPGIGGILRP
nr:hypothetical protein [Tsuneonella dongtanensis]